MQPYTSSLARCRAWESPAGALLQSASQLFGRAADAVASRILCSLFSPASTYEHRGDALAAIGSQAHAIIDASLSREMSRNIRVERWGGLCRRIHASGQKNQFYAFAACSASCCKNKYPAGAPVWGRRPVRWPCGQPAGCVDVQNAIARPLCWLKGCPTGCWPQSLEWSSSQWCSLVDAAATSTTSTPTANISMLVKHIDGGRGGEGRGRRRALCARRRPIAASTASAMAGGSSTAMWPEMARINMQKIQRD